MSSRHTEIDPRSNSLDGHARKTTYSHGTVEPFRQASAQSLDRDVKELREVYTRSMLLHTDVHRVIV